MAVNAPAADENESQSSEDELGIFGLYATNSDRVGKGHHVEVAVNGESINMEIDTAADYSIMSSDTYAKKFKAFPLQNTDVQLKTYSGETLKKCGQMLCEVSYNGQEYVLPVIVAESEGKPTLLGQNWLEKIKIDWNKVFSLSQTSGSEYANLFREGYDGMKGIKAHIRVRDGASPIYFKSHPVPYALREAVEAELNKLEENGVIIKVEQSDWASPVVVVPKADGSVRLCGDYKVTIN